MEVAVLEEIGPSSALVQLESAIALRTAVRLDCSSAGFDGIVRECRHEPGLGHFTEIAFNAGQRWSADRYRPAHLLEPNRSKPRLDHSTRGRRRTTLVSSATHPDTKLADTVRRVAQNLAVVCAEMDEVELAQCFIHHFGADLEPGLFTQFTGAYRDAREILAGPYEQPVSPLWQACKIAMLLADVPSRAAGSAAHT